MSSDSKDYSHSTIYEYLVEDNGYQSIISNHLPIVVDFTVTTFHPTHFYFNSN